MIRYARQSDIDGINNIRHQVHMVHFNGRPDIFNSDFSQLKDRVNTFFSSQEFDVIVYEENGVICGMAVLEYIFKPANLYRTQIKYCNIMEFGVDIEHRRKGIGTELFRFIKTQAKNKGYKRLELDVWSFNENAVRFYESVGLKDYRRYMEFNIL